VTDRQTDHATPSVTVGRIYVRSTAMRPNKITGLDWASDKIYASEVFDILALYKSDYYYYYLLLLLFIIIIHWHPRVILRRLVPRSRMRDGQFINRDGVMSGAPFRPCCIKTQSSQIRSQLHVDDDSDNSGAHVCGINRTRASRQSAMQVPVRQHSLRHNAIQLPRSNISPYSFLPIRFQSRRRVPK